MGENKKEFTLKRLFEERKSLSPKQVVDKFDEWAMNGKYEEDMETIRCRGPELVTQTVREFYTNIGCTDIASLKILDVACGTGLVAAELRKCGFRNIYGVDPSSEMLNVALSRNMYDKVFIDYVDGHRLAIDTDSFDCAVVSGGFSLGLMPTNALFEIVRLVKPGGVICVEMLQKNVHTVPEFIDRLEPLCKEFERKGVWQQLKKDVVPEVSIGNPGLLMLFKVLVSEVGLPQLPPLIQ